MLIGAVFPQTEIGADPEVIRSYARGLEQIGFDYVTTYDHVVGADRSRHDGWDGPYDHTDMFHEPLVLLGFLAGISTLGLATGVLVLPQRQAVLVAKQAVEVDVLSGGRLRLGVGIGWNHLEYEALGEDFSTRGRRIDEQIHLMRQLWSEPVIEFDGEHHRVAGAGLNPLPEGRRIPVWLAAGPTRRALDRVGRVADGWIPRMGPGPALDSGVAVLQSAALIAGRDPQEIGIEGRITVGEKDSGKIARDAAAWHRSGARHLALNTMGAGLAGVQHHLDTLAMAVSTIRTELGDSEPQ